MQHAIPTTHGPDSSWGEEQGLVSDPSQATQLRYNGNTPRAGGFVQSKSYLDRPLPPLPPPEVIMAERPNTSGGLGSKGRIKNDWNFDKFDKRVSRDDFYLSMKPKTGPGFKQTQYATYQSQLPTPEDSPRSKATTYPTVPIVRMPTPDSMEDIGPIGMALGSPTHQPVNWGSGLSKQMLSPEPPRSVNPVSPLSSVSSTDSYDMPKEKKSGKWKLFGMFGRKHQETAPVISISQPNELGRYQAEPQSIGRAATGVQPVSSRSNTTSSRKGPKHKPIVIRSQTMPHENSQPTDFRPFGSSGSRNPSFDTSGSLAAYGRSTSNFGSIPIALDQVAPTENSTRNLLDVEIPTITMERYSVMFGNVLQTKPSNSSALLARRQATLKELKQISDAVIQEEEERHGIRPRRATSPQPTRSPAFALFPPTPSSRSSSRQHVSRPVQPRIARSNTSPALLPSPVRATFNDPSNARSLEVPSTSTKNERPTENLTIATLERQRERSAQPPAPTFGPDQSGLILDSPTEMESPQFTPDVIRSSTTRHQIPEPEWQMIDPSAKGVSATSKGSPVSVSRKRLPPAAVPLVQSRAPRSLPSTDEPENTNLNPVEISIARQISISRQQRTMLKPLQTNVLSPKSKLSPSKTSPNAPRIVETKTATPTLIIPEHSETHPLRHRKSERIVVEG